MLEESLIPLAFTAAGASEHDHFQNFTHTAVDLDRSLTTAAVLGCAGPVALGLDAALAVESIALWTLLRRRLHNELAKAADEAVEGLPHKRRLVDLIRTWLSHDATLQQPSKE